MQLAVDKNLFGSGNNDNQRLVVASGEPIWTLNAFQRLKLIRGEFAAGNGSCKGCGAVRITETIVCRRFRPLEFSAETCELRGWQIKIEVAERCCNIRTSDFHEYLVEFLQRLRCSFRLDGSTFIRERGDDLDIRRDLPGQLHPETGVEGKIPVRSYRESSNDAAALLKIRTEDIIDVERRPGSGNLHTVRSCRIFQHYQVPSVVNILKMKGEKLVANSDRLKC